MKRLISFISGLMALAGFSSCRSDADKECGFWFEHPARIWEETVPLGNGRIGMMPWGGTDCERITLNEITMWSGSVQNADNPEAGKHLGDIRRLLFEGRNREAQELMYRTFTCSGPGSGGSQYGNYQMFADLLVDLGTGDAASDCYRRSLNMAEGISQTSYEAGGIRYEREHFTSMTEDVAVAKYSSDRKGGVSFTVTFRRESDITLARHDDALTISGRLSDGITEDGGTAFAGAASVRTKGGNAIYTDTSIVVTGADEAEIIIAMNTDHEMPGKDCEPMEASLMQIRKAKKYDYAQLRKRHTGAFGGLFGRAALELPRNGNSGLSISRRLEAFAEDPTDLDLVATYMQYGRYLLISSTREGSLPPNLQGLWAEGTGTPWNGDYHLNINLQMNLWGAETGNLSELHMPMIDYTRSLVPNGGKTARTYYGSDGWVTHILGNVWGWTSPSEDPSWGATNTAGAWLCRHIWEHYLYTSDTDFLAEYFPVMQGAAEFFSDMLVEDPRTGFLVTAPTTSPENHYIDSNGDVLAICAGSTMDNQLVRELFTNVLDASEALENDGRTAGGQDFLERIASQRERLAPTVVGKYGQIVEWNEDYQEAEPHHRHVSQLYGLYPGNQLTWEATPELMEAAKVTLERRGDQSTGWSMAWKINFWARLKDGDRAFKLLRDLLKPAVDAVPTGDEAIDRAALKNHRWGTFPNLFSSHPPMQIDGNFGGSAGIMEMLLQSHRTECMEAGNELNVIEILPALPSSWPEGSFSGLMARGGIEVSCKWAEGKVTHLTLRSKIPQDIILTCNGITRHLTCTSRTKVRL